MGGLKNEIASGLNPNRKQFRFLSFFKSYSS